jgi:hypothetical protein
MKLRRCGYLIAILFGGVVFAMPDLVEAAPLYSSLVSVIANGEKFSGEMLSIDGCLSIGFDAID